MNILKKNTQTKKKVPRPSYWSGWKLKPNKIEFWLDGENRVHERLEYNNLGKNTWERKLLSP